MRPKPLQNVAVTLVRTNHPTDAEVSVACATMDTAKILTKHLLEMGLRVQSMGGSFLGVYFSRKLYNPEEIATYIEEYANSNLEVEL